MLKQFSQTIYLLCAVIYLFFDAAARRVASLRLVHKKAQNAQTIYLLCAFCAFLWPNFRL